MTEEKKEKSPLELLAESQVKEENLSEKGENRQTVQKTAGRKALFFISLSGLVFVIAVFTALSFSGNGRKNEDNVSESLKISDFNEFARGRLSGDIRSAMNIQKGKGNMEAALPENSEKEAKPAQKKAAANNRNKNEEKDREILENYAKLNDAAAYQPASAGRKRRFVPGGEGKTGGVFLKGREKTGGKGKTLNLHDIKVKVKLDFSIRSTAQSTVVATVTEETGEIPKGAKFYGSARSFVNKRTQLVFSKLVFGREEFSVKGFAVSGKDPGIESEVTDISGENVKSEVKQGAVKTAGAVLTRLAGGVGETVGTAAGNTVNPAAAELEKQEETNKMKQEYRVPAGTSFFIYIE